MKSVLQEIYRKEQIKPANWVSRVSGLLGMGALLVFITGVYLRHGYSVAFGGFLFLVSVGLAIRFIIEPDAIGETGVVNTTASLNQKHGEVYITDVDGANNYILLFESESNGMKFEGTEREFAPGESIALSRIDEETVSVNDEFTVETTGESYKLVEVPSSTEHMINTYVGDINEV